MSQTITQALGSDQDYQLTLRDGSTGAAITTFTTGNTLSAVCWAGGDASSLFSPTVSWIDATAGTIQLSIRSSQTAALGVGTFHLQVSVSSSGKSLLAFDGRLQLTAGPGSASTLPVYGPYSDLQTYFPQIEGLQPDNDIGQFSRERHLARLWLDNIAQRHWRGTLGPLYGSSYPGTATGQDDPQLQAWLDAGRLKITLAVREMVAKMALSIILSSQVTSNEQTVAGRTNPYRADGLGFRGEAEGIAKSAVLEVDVSAAGDGSAYVAIPLGTTRVRRSY